MDNLFNFSEVESTKQYLQPGIQNLTIGGITLNDDSTSLLLKVINESTEAEADLRLSLKGGAKKWTDVKLKHIGTKLTTEEEFNKISSVEALNELFMGKVLRMKLKGREVMKNDKIIVYAELPLPPFAETVDSVQKITFDESNKYDYEKYQEAPSLLDNVNTGGDSNPLAQFLTKP